MYSFSFYSNMIYLLCVCLFAQSFDATSHFENDCDDLLSLYKRVTGEELDLSINADSVEGDY
jgi:Rab GDP dissociation inhibitor